MRYLTRDGDMVDAICHSYYGSSIGMTEKVLEANRFLAEVGLVLPAGLIIELPDFPAESQVKSIIRLWD